MSTVKKIDNLLLQFEPVHLDQLEDVSLMNRRDVKYVFPVDRLPALLSELFDDYQILEVNSNRAQTYETTYFDTDDLSMYHMHHRGEYERHKVRIRKYRDTEKAFLEVKVKDNRGVTEKSRVEWPVPNRVVLSEEEEFLHNHSPYDQKNLLPVLTNNFRRITLVSLEKKVRITIDIQLRLELCSSHSSISFPGLAIAEIKGGDPGINTGIIHIFRNYRIKPMRFSKYCMGVAKLNSNVVSNRFRSWIRYIDRIEEEAEQAMEQNSK